MQLRVDKNTQTTALIQIKDLSSLLLCLQQWLQVDPWEKEKSRKYIHMSISLSDFYHFQIRRFPECLVTCPFSKSQDVHLPSVCQICPRAQTSHQNRQHPLTSSFIKLVLVTWMTSYLVLEDPKDLIWETFDIYDNSYFGKDSEWSDLLKSCLSMYKSPKLLSCSVYFSSVMLPSLNICSSASFETKDAEFNTVL